MGLEVRIFPYEWISYLGGVPVFVQNRNSCVQVCWGDIICVFLFHPCHIVEVTRAFPFIVDNIPEVFKELCFQGVYQRRVNNPWSFVYMQFVLDQGEVIGCFNCANLDYTSHPEIPDLFSIEWSKGKPGRDITRLWFQNAELPGRERLFCRHLDASSGSPGLAKRSFSVRVTIVSLSKEASDELEQHRRQGHMPFNAQCLECNRGRSVFQYRRKKEGSKDLEL